MKNRLVEEIARDLNDAKRRLEELKRCGDAAMSKYDLMMGYDAQSAIPLVANHVAYYERELAEATRFGVQLSLGF